MTSNILAFLTNWFGEHCDENWEHEVGIRIATLDNPGWAVDVRIEDTELEGRSAPWTREEGGQGSWLHWRSTGRAFEARCGPHDLEIALDAFRKFAES